MDNFYHEIPCPEDRAIRKFLWTDYFHDGSIMCIKHDKPNPGDLTLQTQCIWEMDRLWESIPGKTHEEKQTCFEQHFAPRITYFLRFHRVWHFEHVLERTGIYAASAEEILCGRFKATPLLRRLQQTSGKPLYHLRFRTSRGYMDIIFERFSIRRMQGRVDYRLSHDAAGSFWHACMASDARATLERLSGVPESKLDAVALSERMTSRLFLLEQAGDVPGMLALARQIVADCRASAYFEDVYAVFLLGMYGDASDLPALIKLMLHADLAPNGRRNVQDAIERISESEAAARV